MRRKSKTSRGTEKDRYLIPYADLLTLLLGLFVMLYASSITDLATFDKYKEAFFEVFDPNSEKLLDGGEGVLDNKGNKAVKTIIPPREQSLDIVESDLNNTLSEYFGADQLDFRKSEAGLVLSFNEKLLFDKGSAEILSPKIHILDSVASALSGLSNPIEISGHSDSDLIRTSKYPSNWHLASARAINVALYLFDRGLSKSNVKTVSYGAQRPIVSNSTPNGKATNRRVEITISEPKADTPIEKNV